MNLILNSERKNIVSLLQIQNRGQAIVGSNYWDSDHARNGFFFLSWNAGAARLLAPDNQKLALHDMRTAKIVIISRGFWVDQGREAVEVLFEDNSDAPYSIILPAEQCDRLLPSADQEGDFAVTVWTRGGEKLRRPGRYRIVNVVPCLQAWTAH